MMYGTFLHEAMHVYNGSTRRLGQTPVCVRGLPARHTCKGTQVAASWILALEFIPSRGTPLPIDPLPPLYQHGY